VALGTQALSANIGGLNGNGQPDENVGSKNVAVGAYSLNLNTTGGNNVALGYIALQHNTTGQGNVAVGPGNATGNVTGSLNTSVGALSGFNLTGSPDATLGNNNIFIGVWSGFADGQNGQPPVQYNNSTAIGYQARVAESNALVLGGSGGYAVNVGIGTSAPATTFHMVGKTAQFDGLDNNGNPTGQSIIIDPVHGQITVGGQPLGGSVTVPPGQTFVPVVSVAGGNMGTASFASLISNDTASGTANTVLGSAALQNISAGWADTAVGNSALQSVTTGWSNVAVGANAQQGVTTGTSNVGIGNGTLSAITTDASNTAVGDEAMAGSTGSYNVAIGASSGFGGNGSNNTYLGTFTGTNWTPDVSNATAIGYMAQVTQSNTMILGTTSFSQNTPVNVGIGTTTPTATLHVSGPGNGQNNGVVGQFDGPVQMQSNGGVQTIVMDPTNGAAFQVPVRVTKQGDIDMGAFTTGPQPGQ
jgi:hypothetical protein